MALPQRGPLEETTDSDEGWQPGLGQGPRVQTGGVGLTMGTGCPGEGPKHTCALRGCGMRLSREASQRACRA